MIKKTMSLLLVFIMVILIAACKKDNNYQVSFNSHGGNAIHTLNVSKGTIDLPTPEKDGYLFSEWQLDGKTFTNETKVNHDIKLDAVWEKITDVITYQVNDNNLTIKSYSGNIKNLVLPNMIDGHIVNEIGMNAFKDSTIKSIQIPNSVLKIDGGAFSHTHNLEDVSFYGDYMGMKDTTITSEEYDSIMNEYQDVCTKSSDPDFPNDESKWVFPDGCPIHKVMSETTPIHIDGEEYFNYHLLLDLKYYDGYRILQTFGDGTFADSSIKNIELPNHLQFYSSSMFKNPDLSWGASQLENITVKEDNPDFISIDGILYSKDKTQLIAYPAANTADSFTIPTEVTQISVDAFLGNNDLTKIIIPKDSKLDFKIPNMTIIYNNFFNVNSLKTIEVDKDNELYSSMDGVLFNKDKTRLISYPQAKEGTSYTIPSTVTDISAAVFDNVKNIQSIDISSSVQTIGSGAFYDAPSLKEVIIHGNGNSPIIQSDNVMIGFFRNNDSNLTIYVPNNMYHDYMTTAPWNYDADKIEPLSE